MRMPLMIVSAMLIMLMRRLFLQKVRVNVQLGIQVKPPQIKHLRQRHLAKMHYLLRRTRIHVREPVLQSVQFRLRHQIGLADENLIGKTHLTPRLLPIIQLLCSMLGIHQSQNGVQQKTLRNLIVHEKSLRHRTRIGQTRGLNHHTIKVQLPLALLRCQGLQSRTQILANRTTNTAIAHLNDLLFGIRHQNIAVNILLAKLIFNNGNLLAMRLRQHTLEQRGFART